MVRGLRGCGKVLERQDIYNNLFEWKGGTMKKLLIPMIAVVLAVFVSAAVADSGGEKAGRLFLSGRHAISSSSLFRCPPLSKYS